MPAKQIAKSVAAASLCAAMIIAGPAAAQRVIRGYGADEDFSAKLLPPTATARTSRITRRLIRSSAPQVITAAASSNS